MNQLNSILLEGTLLRDPFAVASLETTFEIESCRIHQETLEKSFINIGIITQGKQAEVCKKHLIAGRGVRVVGRLIEDAAGDICILAEHVEFTPKVGKAQAKAREEIV